MPQDLEPQCVDQIWLTRLGWVDVSTSEAGSGRIADIMLHHRQNLILASISSSSVKLAAGMTPLVCRIKCLAFTTWHANPYKQVEVLYCVLDQRQRSSWLAYMASLVG